jgi:hypothetical protein
MVNKNSNLLKSFIKYCEKHPEERFWQALRNWAGVAFIYASCVPEGRGGMEDTFYWEKNKNYLGPIPHKPICAYRKKK